MFEPAYAPPMAPQGPPPEMGGLPPELMAQLAGAGGGPPPMAPPEPPQAPAGGASEILQGILELADAYRQQEDSQQNLLLVEQLRTIAQKILANEEKEDEGLMQGKFSPSALRRLAPGG